MTRKTKAEKAAALELRKAQEAALERASARREASDARLAKLLGIKPEAAAKRVERADHNDRCVNAHGNLRGHNRPLEARAKSAADVGLDAAGIMTAAGRRAFILGLRQDEFLAAMLKLGLAPSQGMLGATMIPSNCRGHKSIAPPHEQRDAFLIGFIADPSRAAEARRRADLPLAKAMKEAGIENIAADIKLA